MLQRDDDGVRERQAVREDDRASGADRPCPAGSGSDRLDHRIVRDRSAFRHVIIRQRRAIRLATETIGRARGRSTSASRPAPMRAQSFVSGSTMAAPAKSFSQLAEISAFFRVACRAAARRRRRHEAGVKMLPLLTRSKKFSAVGRHQLATSISRIEANRLWIATCRWLPRGLASIDMATI